MKKTLTIKTNNGDKEYPIKELDFTNVVCDLEDMGIDIMENIDGKTMSFCRAALAIFTGETDKRKAGAMLSEHIKNGGTLEVIYTAFYEAMEEAGFGGTSKEPATEETIVQMPEQTINKDE